MKTLGIFLFDQVEVLDFAGPFEVFSVGAQLSEAKDFRVITFSANGKTITAVNGLSVNPGFSFEDVPPLDYLVIPGGDGTKQVIEQEVVLQTISRMIKDCEWCMTVCSGTRIPAKLGLLDSRPFCTHYEVYPSIAQLSPSSSPKPKERFVQSDSKLYTAAGISAGIDLSFFLLEKTSGKNLALATATYMEYLNYPS